MVSRPASTLAGTQAALLVAFMWGAYFLNYSDRQAISSMFKAIQPDLGLSDTQLGLTGSVFLWVYGICCPLAGQLADRFSKRVLVVFSLAVWSVVTVLTGLATSAWMLLSLRAAMGISEALYMPAAIALTANACAPEKRSRAIAMLTTAQVAGAVGGGWFGGWMAREGLWRQAFFYLGALGLAYAIPYFLFLRSVPEASSPRSAQPSPATHPEATEKISSRLAIAELFRVPTFGILCVVFPAFVFGLWMLYTWLPTFLNEKFHLDLNDAAFTAVVYLQTATFFGLVLGGFLADKLFLRTKAARLWLMAVSLVCCAPCLHFIGNSDDLNTMRLAAVAFGLFGGFLMGNIFPAAFEVVPASSRASAVGLLNFFGSITAGFAALVVGMWKQSVGVERLLTYTSLLYLAAGILLIVGILSLFARDYQRNHPQASDA